MVASTSMQFCYVGTELEVFAKAANWKNYVGKKLRPYITGSVIEVGAGLGGSTKYLCDRSYVRWLCLDPDAKHALHLEGLIAAGKLPPCCEARCGVLADLAPGDRADTIIYVDVLEHIQDDEAEMLAAALILHREGTLWFSHRLLTLFTVPSTKLSGIIEGTYPKTSGVCLANR